MGNLVWGGGEGNVGKGVRGDCGERDEGIFTTAGRSDRMFIPGCSQQQTEVTGCSYLAVHNNRQK